MQTPDTVIIAYEMVHDTRVIPLDGRPHVGSGIRQLMGDSRGRLEGNTLVIETTNFTDRTSISENSNGLRHSQALRLVERITRVRRRHPRLSASPIDDPLTYARPWTMVLSL